MLKDKKRKLIKALAMTSILLLNGIKANASEMIEDSHNLEYAVDYIVNNEGFVTTNVNFRVGPNTTYDIITILPCGTVVNVLAKMPSDWYLVQFNNQIGYISMDYVNIINKNKIDEQLKLLPTNYKALIATTDVNIRLEPNGKKIGELKKGEKIPYLNKLENGWYECLYNNETCYVCGDYVEESTIINGNITNIVYMTNNSNIYDYPFGNQIADIPKYELAYVYGEVDNYYYIESEGFIGFILKNNCEQLKDKFVVVDISSQKLIVYDDVNEILTSKVVTGKEGTPTDLGCYSIYTKEKNRYLVGEDYKTFVKYWMGFNGGEGLHDASWRNKFGGNVYVKNGSHGCVNLPENFAKTLYNEISVGDKVLVKK